MSEKKPDFRVIRSIHGDRFLEYQGIQHDLDNLLNSQEVVSILRYSGDLFFIYIKGLFDNPSFLVFRISTIFWKIHTDLPEQQKDILDFFFWLRDKFLPFLARAEQFMPDVRSQVNQYLEERQVPSIENILDILRKHFTMDSSVILCCIFIRKIPESTIQKTVFPNRFARANQICKPAMAKLYGIHFEVSPLMAASVGLTVDQLTILLSKLEELSRIQGKPFYGKLLTMSVAQNILVGRLAYRGKMCDMFAILMRVLGRLFQ
jgi:hypothetical protein